DVVAEPPVVDTRRSEVSTRIAETAIDALPLNGREFVDLVKLVPGATPATGGAPGGNLDQISIFGERTAALSFLVDGADNNNPLTGGPFVRYTQDSIQEFEVVTTGYEAQFGRAQGGVTNIVTRSGSNDWQGSAFLFARNDALDSSNVPDQEAPKLERSQLGGAGGRPPHGMPRLPRDPPVGDPRVGPPPGGRAVPGAEGEEPLERHAEAGREPRS